MKRTITYNCDYCGGEVTKSKSTYNRTSGNHYCNKDCYWAHNRGENHYKYAAANIKCDYCGKPIEVNQWLMEHLEHHFCGKTCSDKYKKEYGPRGKDHPIYKSIEIECVNCGKKTIKKPFELNKNEYSYCSKECLHEHRRKTEFHKGENNKNWRGGLIDVECAVCGKPMKRKQSIVRDHNWFVCSPKCRGQYIIRHMSGENSYNWKFGATGVSMGLRNITKYTQWREDVFRRDGYVCKICERDKYIVAHHIHAFSDILKENNITTVDEGRDCEALWNINNGVTFCTDCHRDIHSLLGNKEIQEEAMRNTFTNDKPAKSIRYE